MQNNFGLFKTKKFFFIHVKKKRKGKKQHSQDNYLCPVKEKKKEMMIHKPENREKF